MKYFSTFAILLTIDIAILFAIDIKNKPRNLSIAPSKPNSRFYHFLNKKFSKKKMQGCRVKSRHFKLIFVITQLRLQPFFFSAKKQLNSTPRASTFSFPTHFYYSKLCFFSPPSKFLFTQSSPTEGNFNFLKDFSSSRYLSFGVIFFFFLFLFPIYLRWLHFFSSFS